MSLSHLFIDWEGVQFTYSQAVQKGIQQEYSDEDNYFRYWNNSLKSHQKWLETFVGTLNIIRSTKWMQWASRRLQGM